MNRRSFLPIILFVLMLTPALSGCEVKTLYEVRLSDLEEANTQRELRRDNFMLFVVPSPGTDFVHLTLIAVAEPRPELNWEWGEFGNWTPARQDTAFSDWFDRSYLDVSVSGDSRCPLQVERFDHREEVQDLLYAAWRSGVKPVHRLAEGTKGILVGFPVQGCSAVLDLEDMDYAQVVAEIRGPDGKLLDNVRIDYRIELRETFVDWWFF